MASRRWFAPGISLALLLAFAPWSALAADWLPLQFGNRWEYRGDLGGQQTQDVIFAPKIHGREVMAKLHGGDPDTGLQNFWLLDAGGNVLLAGFLRPTASVWPMSRPSATSPSRPRSDHSRRRA